MRRSLSSCALLLGTTVLPAQGAAPAPSAPPTPVSSPAELAGAKQRLQQALRKTAGIVDTAFAAEWGGGRQERSVANPVPTQRTVIGSWHHDRLHVSLAGEQQDEIVVSGRAQIARNAKVDWKPRSRRLADGRPSFFVPDPPIALRLLAASDLAVTRRTVGSLDERPVEVVSVTLSPEQVAELTLSGGIDDRIVMTSMSQLVAQLRQAGDAPKVMQPEARIDLVVWLDPATDLVQQLHFRTWAKSSSARTSRPAAGQGDGEPGQPAPKPAGDATESAAPDAPTDGSVFDDSGLPIRERKDTLVTDYVLRLRDHGKTSAPPLTDVQKSLLGL